jgi:hypothetical protein
LSLEIGKAKNIIPEKKKKKKKKNLAKRNKKKKQLKLDSSFGELGHKLIGQLALASKLCDFRRELFLGLRAKRGILNQTANENPQMLLDHRLGNGSGLGRLGVQLLLQRSNICVLENNQHQNNKEVYLVIESVTCVT